MWSPHKKTLDENWQKIIFYWLETFIIKSLIKGDTSAGETKREISRPSKTRTKKGLEKDQETFFFGPLCIEEFVVEARKGSGEANSLEYWKFLHISSWGAINLPFMRFSFIIFRYLLLSSSKILRWSFFSETLKNLINIPVESIIPP